MEIAKIELRSMDSRGRLSPHKSLSPTVLLLSRRLDGAGVSRTGVSAPHERLTWVAFVL